MSLISVYQNKIDIFLNKLLSQNDPKTYKINPKIIHDVIWGTNRFYSWEIALIDSPLLQRLRRIHQTGLAYLVYPTATHTRFEHSLGVTILVEKLINHLNTNVNDEVINKDEEFNLRLSALLHDVGHSFFSHVSELVYHRMEEFQLLINEINNKFGVTPKGHELFSFFIVRSKEFKKYFKSLLYNIPIENKHERYINNIDWDIISGYIIGYSKDPAKKYLSDIINGPIDCDKLDYLARDAHFAGPVIVYDIDRFFYSINILERHGRKRLTVILSGINALEQIVISRMMLFSYIYHHHKVRSAEAMIKRLCFDIISESNNTTTKNNTFSIKLEHPTDFLYYTDETILNNLFTSFQNKKIVKKTINDLLYRNLWVRAQMLSNINTEEKNPDDRQRIEFMGLEKDLHDPENVSDLKNIKNLIIKEANRIYNSNKISERDIWIDTPSSPSVKEAKEFIIKKKHNVEEGISFPEVFPLDHWVDAYKANKWRAHIFCKRDIQKTIFEASKKILEEKFGITISSFTEDFCKIT
jgi:HD superfamily phosphohydrolase